MNKQTNININKVSIQTESKNINKLLNVYAKSLKGRTNNIRPSEIVSPSKIKNCERMLYSPESTTEWSQQNNGRAQGFVSLPSNRMAKIEGTRSNIGNTNKILGHGYGVESALFESVAISEQEQVSSSKNIQARSGGGENLFVRASVLARTKINLQGIKLYDELLWTNAIARGQSLGGNKKERVVGPNKQAIARSSKLLLGVASQAQTDQILKSEHSDRTNSVRIMANEKSITKNNNLINNVNNSYNTNSETKEQIEGLSNYITHPL